jgi:hypothetical protein
METNPRSLFNNSLIYGLITGAISIVFSVITYIFDVSISSPIKYFSFLILLAGMIYGTLQYRNSIPGGFISFGKAFTSGFLIVLISAFIASVYTYIFLVFIDPAYLQKIVEQSMDETTAKMVAKGLSEEQMEPALAMTRKFLNPTFMSIIALVSSALVGAILSLIAAAFIKKEDNSFEGQFKNEG